MPEGEILEGPWGPGDPCEICRIPYPELHTDHIIPKMLGGKDDPDNIQWICPNCHHLKSQAERREMGELIRSRMAQISPEKRVEWGRKISGSVIRGEKLRAAWTPERRAEWSERMRGNTNARDAAVRKRVTSSE
jgi:HNH endonuclease